MKSVDTDFKDTKRLETVLVGILKKYKVIPRKIGASIPLQQKEGEGTSGTKINKRKYRKNNTDYNSSDDDFQMPKRKEYIRAVNNKEEEFEMNSRASPKSLFISVNNMTTEQKQYLIEIGFKTIVEMKFKSNPMKLSYYVVDNFDENSSTLKLKKGAIQITEKTVYDVLGVPAGDIKIESLDRSDHDDTNTIMWRDQFEGKKDIRPKDVMEYMRGKKEVDRLFLLNFLVLFATSMAEGTKLGTCNLKFLPFITQDTDVSKLNWCRYIYECLLESKKGWNRGVNGEYYSGPQTFLVVS